MHQAAVVPHHELVRAPAVPVDGAEGRRGRVELVHQRPSLRIIHPLDGLRVVAEEQTVASGLGMGANNRVGDRRHLPALRLGHRLVSMAP